MRIFKNKPVIVKDYVKSRKHEWEEACYIPDASDKQRVEMVLRNFIDRQGSELNGGIEIREFVSLEHLTKHPKSGMPLSNEYRLFFLLPSHADLEHFYQSILDFEGNRALLNEH
nr:ATP-grasp domain-containing protein [Paenibacillus caui]